MEITNNLLIKLRLNKLNSAKNKKTDNKTINSSNSILNFSSQKIPYDNSKINYCVTRNVDLADNKGYKLVIQNSAIKKYFLDSNCQIRNKCINQYIEIYKYVYETLYNQEEQRKAELSKTINSTSKVRSLDIDSDLTNAFIKSLVSKDISTSIVSTINDSKAKKELAEIFLGIEEKFSKQKFEDAQRITELIFELSKNEDDYDFSALDEKIKLIQDVDNLISCFGQDNDLFNRIAGASKDKNGKINYDYAFKLADLVQTVPVAQPSIEYIAGLMNKFIKYDSDKKEEIYSSMLELARHYPIDEEDKSFEDAFEYCFNPISYKFSLNRFNALKEILKETDKYINIEADFNEEYPRFCAWEKEVLNSYFSLHTDPKTGELSADAPSGKAFVENYNE